MIIDVYRNIDIPESFSRKRITAACNLCHYTIHISMAHYDEIMGFILQEKGIVATTSNVGGKREIARSIRFAIRDLFLIPASKSDIAKIKLKL